MKPENTEQDATEPVPLKRKLLLVLLAIAVAGCWRGVAWISSSSSRSLAADLASVSVFVGPAYPDPANRQMLFLQNTESGVGIHTGDMANGNRRLVFNVEEAFMRSGSVGVLGWSPDGSVFGYTIPVRSNRQHIVVCSGYVGQRIDYFRVDSQLTTFAWLSADRFVYADQRKDIRVVARNEKRKWAEVGKVTSRVPGAIDNLSVLGTGAVVWRQGNAIYRINPALKAPEAELLWEGPAATRVDLSCGRERNSVLIGIADGTDKYAVLSLYTGPPRVTNFVHEFRERRATGLKMINAGQGYALICSEPSGKTLLLSPEGEPADKQLLAGGNVQYVTPQGRKLYIAGCTNVEPPGIWEYDCQDGALRCVLAGSDRGEALYRDFRHQAGVLEIGGREVTYHLWMPEPTIFRQKFPLIIGQTPHAWTPYPYMAVNAGICFVTIDRPSWHTHLDRWVEDVTAVYEHLKGNVRVDTGETYLYGRSAETSYLSSLAAEKPHLWKGALLFSPGTMPDPARCNFDKMFVDAGARDHDALKRLPKYQAQAARHGLPVRLLIHETSRHTSWSRATQRARLENLAEFLETQ